MVSNQTEDLGTSASSITTRIKTHFVKDWNVLFKVRVHLPLQQGLRQKEC